MQEVLLAILFLAALFYLGRLVYQSFFKRNNKAACAKGCASCSAVDIEKIERDMNAQMQAKKKG